MTHYIPTTNEEEKEIFDKLNIKSFTDLINIIPKSLLIKDKLGLDNAISEYEATTLLNKLSNKNESNKICFLGDGIYDHFIPAAVDFLSNRSEFYTAYTPYQAEVSQGTLQYLYEFQTMICELSGMDIANASLYDGASALAEACNIALSSNKKNKILYSPLISNKYIDVTKTYFSGRKVEFIKLPRKNGITDISYIENINIEEVSAIIIQSPNKYGLLESWSDIKNNIKTSSALLIAVSDPVSLSIIKPPGSCGADIYIGEGQGLGNYMNYGGPLLGLIAIKEKYKRKMPGRIIGKTRDKNGKTGYVLTLQTREQHIRRANATSNICTNQGLLALRTTLYLSLLGKYGLPHIAKLCYNKSQYAANKISKLKNYSILFTNNFVKEFLIKTNLSAKRVVKHCSNKNILIGLDKDDCTDSILQIAVTEKRTKEEIDLLIKTLKECI